MSRKLFVNIAVKDLERSVEFFTRLGFTFNRDFSDETSACMIVNDEAFFMLLIESRFSDFTKKPLVDAHGVTEALYCVSADSRAEVDQLVETAIAAGGKPANDPQDHGFMYGWSFQDPDGHQWEVIWMDPSAAAG